MPGAFFNTLIPRYRQILLRQGYGGQAVSTHKTKIDRSIKPTHSQILQCRQSVWLAP